VDEFQNFATPSFDIILSQARSYGLGLTIAHQQASQLDSKIRDRLWNASTMILFRTDPKDAAQFKALFAPNDDPSDKMRTKLTGQRDQLKVETQILRMKFTKAKLDKEKIERDDWTQTGKIQALGFQMKNAELEIDTINQEIRQIEEKLGNLRKATQVVDASILPNLPKFRAIYRAATGSVQLIETPQFPGPSPASYAEIIRKRTVEKYACEPAPNVVQSKEDARNPSDEPDEGPTILSDRPKARHSRKRGTP
jgi:hypothetical protein